MSWLQLRFHREVVTRAGANGDQVAYRVDASVDAASGVPRELFVLQTADDVYSRAATLFDLLNLPATKGAAQDPGAPTDFYRVAAVSQLFDRPAGADAFVLYVKGALSTTNRAWSLNSDAQVGQDELVVYDSSVPT